MSSMHVFVKTVLQLRNSIIAIMAIVALATAMDVSGLISTLAHVLVNITGSSYVFISPIIGALGTFVTGIPIQTFCSVSCKPWRRQN